MKIKKGDKVKMLSGKDKGKAGKVLQVFAGEGRLMIEGLNLIIKHQKGKRQGEKGQRIQFPRAVRISQVSLICPKCGRDARVGYKINKLESGEKVKVRVCKKCKEEI
ncbi:MAG: 50S ribosomal protein L24 [Patescibacteria group bacterium]